MNKVFPQTMARTLAQSFSDPKLKAIGDFGCCAFTALWIMGIEGDIGNICILGNQIGKSLDGECTVFWKKFFKNVSGKDIEVEFLKINSLADVKKYGRCEVKYVYNGSYHWVGVERGKVAYNSLAHSECLKYGTPTEARIITWK